ncbi:prepilin-type N-terminal cleavage/methylation domain-containing protein [Candidatus Uhrbacteria bacterium]|nr:prepilin-type N-terminal cleavage/methylation domain-containing protein [Candidatus Uhrbacteria bacterium]
MMRRGFTLLELILVIGLFALLVTAATAALPSLFATDSDEPALRVESLLRTSARRARDGMSGLPWGVYLPYNEVTRSATEVVLFAGTSYALRDTTKDIVSPFEKDAHFSSVTLSGGGPSSGNDHEIAFGLFDGETSQYGSIAIDYKDATYVISISETGMAVQ